MAAGTRVETEMPQLSLEAAGASPASLPKPKPAASAPEGPKARVTCSKEVVAGSHPPMDVIVWVRSSPVSSKHVQDVCEACKWHGYPRPIVM